MGGNDSKPEEAAGAPPHARRGAPRGDAPRGVAPRGGAPAPAPRRRPTRRRRRPAPAPAASASGPIGNLKDMRLTVPPNDAAALKCLVAARAGGIAAYQVAGEVRRDPPFPPPPPAALFAIDPRFVIFCPTRRAPSADLPPHRERADLRRRDREGRLRRRQRRGSDTVRLPRPLALHPLRRDGNDRERLAPDRSSPADTRPERTQALGPVVHRTTRAVRRVAHPRSRPNPLSPNEPKTFRLPLVAVASKGSAAASLYPASTDPALAARIDAWVEFSVTTLDASAKHWLPGAASSESTRAGRGRRSKPPSPVSTRTSPRRAHSS